MPLSARGEALEPWADSPFSHLVASMAIDTNDSDRRHVRRGREALYRVFSQADADRHVLAVLVDLAGGNWRVATARELTANERQLDT